MRLSRWFAAVVCWGWLVAMVSAAEIPGLFNTGVDNGGNLLPQGAVDPHYALVGSDDPNFPGPNAFTVLNNGYPLPNPWIPDGPISRWISADQSSGLVAGFYDYQLTFDLTGFLPGTAVLGGQFSTDNEMFDIQINGNSTAINNGFTDGYQWGVWTPFSITNGFRPGLNTLRFHTHNDDGFAGLRTEIRGTAKAGPTAIPTILVGPVTNSANGHIYYLLTSDTWWNSEAEAVRLGGHLATINDQAEQDWVFSSFSTYGGVDRSLWIGLREVSTEGNYQWVSGEPVSYTHWALGEPNNNFGACGGESYVQMVKASIGGSWNDIASPTTPCFTTYDPVHGVVEVSIAACGCPQNLVVNGSFETPVLPSGTYAHLDPLILAPWQTTDDSFEIWAVSPPSAMDGTQDIEILSHAPTATVFQAIPTEVGQDYSLSFHHSPRPGVDSTLTVAIDAEVVATFAETGSALTGFRWLWFKTNFTATAASTTISFSDCCNGAGTHIDKVAVERLRVPGIFAFSPTSGPVGATVTITGRNFCPISSNNIVFFGIARAVVASASMNSLVVAVPAGATLAPVKVTVCGRTATASGFFNPIFPGSFNITFSPRTNFAVGSSPRYVAVGDFNGDGIPDVATANAFDGVTVLYGTGTGSFTSITDLPAGLQPIGLAVADFNGDGILDLAACAGHDPPAPATSSVAVWLGSPSGTFSPRMDFPVGNYPNSIVAGDFNHDGWIDMATANGWDQTLSVLPGDGTGSFGARTDFPTGLGGDAGSNSLGIAIGDFNKDGNLDLALSNQGLPGDVVSIHLGDGSGNFSLETNMAVGAFPREVVVGDFNGDGILDLATANHYSNSVSVFLGQSGGLLWTRTDFQVGDGPHGIAVGDFNGDGRPDLVTANKLGNSITVLLGDGRGGFGGRTDIPVENGGSPYSVGVGDFNLDGKPDIATANAADDTIAVFLNTTAPPLPSYTLSATTAGGGIVVPDPLRAGYSSNTLVEITARPALDWQFLTWLGDADGSDPVVDITMTTAKCLEAVFGTKLFTATGGNGSLTVIPSADFYPWGSSVRLVAVPTPGYYFAGWSGPASGDSNPLAFTVLNANETVPALFAPLNAAQFALSVIPDGFGRVTVSPRANLYTLGQIISLRASPDPGQQFLGWTGDASGTNSPLTLRMNQSRLITAHFSKHPRLSVATCFGRIDPEAVHLVLQGEAGEANQIEISDDLRAWAPLASITNFFGTVQFTDQTATNSSQRFYRAVAPGGFD